MNHKKNFIERQIELGAQRMAEAKDKDARKQTMNHKIIQEVKEALDISDECGPVLAGEALDAALRGLVQGIRDAMGTMADPGPQLLELLADLPDLRDGEPSPETDYMEDLD